MTLSIHVVVMATDLLEKAGGADNRNKNVQAVLYFKVNDPLKTIANSKK